MRSEFRLLEAKELNTNLVASAAQRLPRQEMVNAGHNSALMLTQMPTGEL